MSDRVDWIPVAVVASWSAIVVYQASSAINEWRKKSQFSAIMEERHHQMILDNERRMTEYGRITKRGEKFNGWKSCKFGNVSAWQLIPPMWPKNGDDALVDTSVLAFVRANGNYDNYVIRRYSLIAPGLYDDIVQIFVDDWPSVQCFIDENVVAIGWIRKSDEDDPSPYEIRIVLVDANSKTYRLLKMTTSPSQNTTICTMFRYSINGNLMVLFRDRIDASIYTFRLVEYGISPSESVHSPIAHQVESRQFDWPQGNWSFISKFHDSHLRFPGTFYLMRNRDDLNDSRVISLDRHGIHDFGRQSDWVSKFKRTRLGLRMAEVKDSLEKVVPGGENESVVRYEMHRSQLFARVRVSNDAHLVHRPLSVPSLKYLAAEAFCLANPNLDLADIDWTKSIGFDISDGILEGKKPTVIRL